MSTSPIIRRTRSGACASCGAYRLSQHRPTCQPDVVRCIRLEDSHRARIDAQLSAVARTYARQQDALMR